MPRCVKASRWLCARIFGMMLLGAGIAACESTGMIAPEATTAPGTYLLGDAQFSFSETAVLQTWPLIPYSTPPHFARLAVRTDAASLVPALAGDTRPVQVDVLTAAMIPDADGILQAGFSDWVKREEAPAESVYKFTITSQRGDTGQRIAYLRQRQKTIGLDSLAPFKPQTGAPIYLMEMDGAHVATLIECGPVPAAYGGGDYCSLRRQLEDSFGYRVLFPQALLTHWREIDEAARNLVTSAEM